MNIHKKLKASRAGIMKLTKKSKSKSHDQTKESKVVPIFYYMLYFFLSNNIEYIKEPQEEGIKLMEQHRKIMRLVL